MKLDHIGIAVADIDAANELIARLLGRAHYKTEAVEEQGAITSFFTADQENTSAVHPAKLELIGSTAEGSPIDKFVQKRGPGLHHLAFEVEDIVAEMKRLEADGFELLQDRPKLGADNKLICFLHPKSTNGVLVEICQSITEDE